MINPPMNTKLKLIRVSDVRVGDYLHLHTSFQRVQRVIYGPHGIYIDFGDNGLQCYYENVVVVQDRESMNSEFRAVVRQATKVINDAAAFEH